MVTQTGTTIEMPQLGESVTEGTLGTWLKQVGEQVEKYEPLVEVVTDKVNTEIPAPVGGTLVEILVEPETTVPVGTPLCVIDEGKSAAATAPAQQSEPSATPQASQAQPETAADSRIATIPDEDELLRHRSSPAVRRIAAEHDLDISAIPGTGIGGRVTKQDILAYIEAHQPAQPAAAVTSPPPAAPAPEPAPQPQPQPRPEFAAPAPAAPPQAPRTAPTPSNLKPGDRLIPLTPMRRAIAENMVRSKQISPHAAVVMEVDMTNVVARRARWRDAFREREGIDLTYLPFAIQAVIAALRQQPRLNAVWSDDGIIERGEINIGVAVALDDGLIVPVIKHADRLSLTGLMHAIHDLATRARGGQLSPDDMADGTFTINNPGTFGSLVSTPILVQPQVAILSTEAIIKRPVVVGDMIGIRSMMNLSLTIDHRALDGLAAARFLKQVKDILEATDETAPMT